MSNILMLIGGVLWLVGELWGVFKNSKHNGSPDPNDTTSQWVWLLERKYPIIRIILAVFIISLFGHLEFGWWLLP